jgi:putative Ca2+/H+ antiporter (TMEM165/GDT1 family)
MDVFFISTLVVVLAEMGDKTQLLALLLAARFRVFWPIALGILGATAANHLVAAFFGTLVSQHLTPEILRWTLAISFLGMAVWMLVPDKMDGEPRLMDRLGAFGATLISFFLIEIGDKTQVATIALAARFDSVFLVAAGTTAGMMIADCPMILIGDAVAKRVNLSYVRFASALMFLLFGLGAALGVGF